MNNDRAVRFRKWAGQIVKDYTIQGWTMDKERLKKGHMFTDEYFERQLENIREIRLSERKFYQKVTDLYATAFDYDKDAKTTRQFFKMVQNKMHWAVHRHTAAVLIFNAIKYLHIRNYYNLLNLFSCSFCLRGIIPSRHHYHPLTNRFGGNTDAQLPPKRKISGHGWEGFQQSTFSEILSLPTYVPIYGDHVEDTIRSSCPLYVIQLFFYQYLSGLKKIKSNYCHSD